MFVENIEVHGTKYNGIKYVLKEFYGNDESKSITLMKKFKKIPCYGCKINNLAMKTLVKIMNIETEHKSEEIPSSTKDDLKKYAEENWLLYFEFTEK